MRKSYKLYGALSRQIALVQGGGYKHLFGKGYVTDITITDGEVIKKGMFGGGEKIITSVRLSSGVKELKGGLFQGLYPNNRVYGSFRSRKDGRRTVQRLHFA